MAAVPLHALPGGHAELKQRVAPPVAVNDDYSVAKNTVLQVSTANGVMANDLYDVGLVPGVDLIMEQATSPQHGNVLINQDGSFDYIPYPNYVGDDNFNYYIGYSGGPSNTVTVTIHVKQPPVTVNDDYNAIMNTTLTVSLPQGVMQNDIYDAGLVPGQDLIMQQATGAQHGTVTIHGDGTFSYTPNTGYAGDDAFDYYIGYSLGPSNISTVTIHVKKPAVAVETLPAAMTTTYGTASTAAGFHVSGTNLSGNITITAPAHFEVSADGGATFGATATVMATANQVNTTNVLVRLKADADAGTYNEIITVSSQDADAADAIIPASTVNPLSVTVQPDNATKVYGDADPVLTYTVTPALIGADVFSGALTRSPGEDVNSYAISAGSLSLSANYLLTVSPGTFTITARPLTISGTTGQSKTYGDADPVLTYSVSPTLQPGDAFTGALSRDPGENVGSYATTLGTLSAGSNYTLVFVPGNLLVTPKPVTVTADARSKTYGDADPALTYTFSPSPLPGDVFSGSLTRASGEDVGSYAISQGSLSLGTNYVINFTGDNLTIGTKAITVTADARSKTYGDADPALTYTFSPSPLPGDVFSGSLTRAPGEHVGNYAISQGSLSLGSNYVLIFTGNNLAIGAKTINVTADPKTKASGVMDPVLTYTYTPALITGDVFTGTLTRDPGESVGIYPIRLGTLTPGSDYLVNYTGDNLTISAKVITVTATAQSKTYGDADPALTYSFTPALDAGDTFSGTLSRAPGEAVGSYAINQGSLTLPAQYVIAFNSANLSIGQKTIAVTADAQTKTYGDADPALTYTFTPSLVTGDTFTGSLSRAAGENVGNYTINQGTLSLNSNYQLTFTGAGLSITPKAITITADAQAKEYGAADPAFTYTHNPALVDSDAFTGTLTRDPGENVGSYAIRQGTLALGSNYTLSFVTANLNVGVKTITVTAHAQSKTYGDADPALTYTYTPALTGTDAFTGTLTRDPGENTGSYTIKQGTLALSSNYVVVYNGDNLVISPKTITVTADAKNKAYGDADPALTYTNAPALLGSDAFTGSLTRAAGENAGIYAISQGSLSAGGNYIITFTGNDFTITKRTVNVTAVPKQKSYGDADPALTYTFAPALVPGDVFTGSLTRDAGENVGNYAINLGTLSLNGNYNITFTGADLTIGAKQIDVTATAMSKTYGDADPVLTYTVAQALIPGDVFTGTLTRAPGENAGVYPILQGSLTLGGNYVLHFTSADFTINKKTITITADAASKIYGDADPVLTYTFTPAPIPGDQFVGSLSRAPGEHVGTYAINLGTLALNANYDLAFNSEDLTIGQRAITVAAKSATKIYGAADPVLGYAITAGTLVPGDVFTGSLTRDAGENVGNYTIRQGTLTPGNNYAVTFTANVFIITKATLAITADAQTKVYGTADPVLTYQATGFQFGDDNNLFTGTLTRDPGENTGVYAILQGTVSAGNNYVLVYNGNNLTITKAPQAITWDQQLISGCGGTTSIQLNATASSGLPVTYTVTNVNVATVSGDILIPVAQGGTIVTATQPGDANHEAAAPVDNNFSYQLSGLVRPHWDDVLVFDNSSNNYVQWQWYKDGSMINGATMAYYSQSTSLSGTYYVVVKDKNGNTSQTCPVTLTAPATATGGIRIQPNPAPAGATATITCNYTDAALQGAKLTITSITGGVLKEITAVHPVMQVSMPNTGGLYIISLRLSNGQIASVNVMIAD
ncbi:hypothetical protein DCC81_18155 [Chitinophaga parva]|uniref:MBG domain-containing protein n=2 Tax=Chitinophaga parva TaxID=2169414 RepID=A0A2T7BIP8_9BACT|nr:hypothetical protein DCC81_18155 [Chitinophaga parva]